MHLGDGGRGLASRAVAAAGLFARVSREDVDEIEEELDGPNLARPSRRSRSRLPCTASVAIAGS